MGEIKEKPSIPLSLFYLRYFAYIFIGTLLIAAIIIFLFSLMLSRNLVYSANEAEKQANHAKPIIEQSDTVTPDLIPELCDYIVFDFEGNVMQGTLTGRAVHKAWNAIEDEKSNIGHDYYTVVRRSSEYCVLQYQIAPQYQSSTLRKYLLPPQTLLILATIISTLFIVVMSAICFGRALKKRLSPLMVAVNKVEQQELDFSISPSGIQEIDTVLRSMDSMRVALKKSLAQQWQAEQEKTKQISALAHDIKTPLTVVRGNAELLLETDLSETQKKYVDYIESYSLQMQAYIKTLIEISRASAGYQICKKSCDTKEFLNELEMQIKALCYAKGKHLEIETGCLPDKIIIDKTLLQRAILNIVNNALDYAKKDGLVKIKFTEENNTMQITVIDDGKGFSEEALRHAKEQFYMEDQSRNSKMHFGMGLYIASCIAQQHGGEIKLENSAETGGAMVTICVQS